MSLLQIYYINRAKTNNDDIAIHWNTILYTINK
jgi:hypothetical protein